MRYLSHSGKYTLFLTSNSVLLKPGPAPASPVSAGRHSPAVRMTLAGANAGAAVSGAERLPGQTNYFIGSDPKRWTTGVPTYAKVHYRQIYQGIDLVFYGAEGQLEYDFNVAPGADAGQIALEFGGARPTIGPGGDLVLTLDGAALGFRRPAVYQTIAGRRRKIEGGYRLTAKGAQFALGTYDHTRELVIDPVLTYFTYLGGSNSDFVGAPGGYYQFDIPPTQSIAADPAGNLYVTGFTNSLDFPTQGAYQSRNPGTPANGAPYVAFITKLDPTGTHAIYSTYLGGVTFGQTKAYAIAIDRSGSAYVTGSTQQADFPVTGGAYQRVCGYLNNNQSTCGGGSASAFLTKLSPSGGSLTYSTFFGPGTIDIAYSVAVDSVGQAYIAGLSSAACASNDPTACFPTTPSAVLPGSTFNGTIHQGTTFNQGSAFVAVFDAAGANLLYSSLYGGMGSTAAGSDGKPGNNGATYGAGVAVDASGNFYLAGSSSSNQLPVTAGAYQRYTSSSTVTTLARGYVAKFSPVASKVGSSLVYSTFLGGSDAANDSSDFVSGIAVDADGNAYVTGQTRSYDFPVTIGATTCTAKNGCQNTGFLTKINSAGTGLVWSTLVGSGVNCCSGEVAIMAPPRLDAAGNVYVGGRLTTSYGFPFVNPLQPEVNAFGGVFVASYDRSGSSIQFSTSIYSPNSNGGIFPAGVDVDAQGNIYVAGYTTNTQLPVTAGAFQPANAGSYDAFIAKINPSGPAPAISPGGIVPNDGSGSTVAPGEWISIFGTNLATTTETWTGNFPTSLGGTTVTIDGKPAYLWYVSPTQINLQVPNDSTTGTVQVVVTTANGTTYATVTLGSFAPAFSLLDSKHVAGIIIRTDGSGAYGGGTYDIVGPTGSSLGYATVAAKAGDTVELFGVGFGPTNPPVSAGAGFNSAAPTTNPVAISINNMSVTPAFAGETGAGLYQINISIPPGLGTGDVTLQASVGGAKTPAVVISLQ
ncbi:MAG: SBBP repeat-containing protein [Acidobacteria bacterium]|nr:SBBP repeat-containing protein [Acidobacteriota bacterium]